MKIGKIINSRGYVVETVAYVGDEIYMYKLKSGEALVKSEPSNCIKPRWNGSNWIESVTKEDLDIHNKEIEEEKKKQEELEQKELNKEDEMANYILELEARLSALEMENK